MKKITLSMVVAATVVASCQKSEVLFQTSEAFTASVESFDSQTKTSMAPEKYVVWSENDRIAIFQGSTLADEFKASDASAGKANAVFTKVKSAGGDYSGGTEIPYTCNVALYPYASGLTLTGAVLKEEGTAYKVEGVLLPSEQTYEVGSFANGAFLMAAVTDDLSDHNLKFKNILGALKLQLKGTQTVKSIAVKGKNGEVLSGAAVVTVYSNNLTPAITMIATEEASKSVTLDCGDGVQLSETTATDFIIALPPVLFSQGFVVTVTDSNNQTYEVSADVANTVLRSSILSMPAFTLGEVQEDKYDDNEEGVEIFPTFISVSDLFDYYRKVVLIVATEGVSCDIDQTTGTVKYHGTGKVWNLSIHAEKDEFGQTYIPTGRYEAADDGSNPFTWHITGGMPEYNMYWGSYMNDILDGVSTLTELTDGTIWVGAKNGEYIINYKCGDIRFRYKGAIDGVSVPADDDRGYYIEYLYLDKTSLTMYPEASYTLLADIDPIGVIYSELNWSSSDNTVATVDQNGKITTVSDGTAIITAQAVGGVSASCTVTVKSATSKKVKNYVVDGKDYGPGIKIGQTIWAPVNCGYEPANGDYKGYPYGKLYQWGRPYGQGYRDYYYADATEPDIVEGPVMPSVGKSEENKNVFYKVTTNPYDWCTIQINDLWGYGTNEKSATDPCPDGWRVPTYRELNVLSDGNYSSWTTNAEGQNGYYFVGEYTNIEGISQVFLPAAGDRKYNGNAYDRGSYGYYWSSTSGSETAYILYFYSSYVNMNFTPNRAYGFSVRCVQE